MKEIEGQGRTAGPRLAGAILAWVAVAGIPPASFAEGAEGNSSPHPVPPAASEIEIDGVLDEAAWAQALVLNLNHETDPGENVAPPVETEFLITHDSDRLYVAFRAFDPEPENIRARLTDRDTAFRDDFVGVILDPFNDERRGFQFFVNPRGVQMDVFLDDISGREDSSWDVIWDSAGRITEEGYLVEFAIPFSSLRFPRSSGEQVWGFDALRFWPRDQRRRISSQPRDRDLNCHLCQVSKMVGFEGISPGRNLELDPTLTGGRIDAREELSDEKLATGDVESDAGLTVKWGVTPNLTLNATLNPDFSQVEADVAQLDVNNTFALFFRERRPFFQEGADFFSTPFNAVFTRNVANPNWGGKATGKLGKSAVGVFAADDEITNLLFPGSQGSDATTLEIASTDAVVRYRRDFGESSALGFLATSREGGDYSNQVAGFDGLVRFRETDNVRFQFLASSTEYPFAVAEEFDQPFGSFDDRAFRLDYNHNSRNWNIYGRYTDVGRDFRADMGFMPRVDFTFLLGGAERVWWGEDDDWWTRFRFGGDWDRTEDQSGQMLEQEAEIFTSVSGPMQSFLHLSAGSKTQFFDGRTFDINFVNTFFEFQPTSEFRFSFFGRVSDAIDFANTQPGESLTLEPSFRYEFGLHLRTTLDHTFQRLTVDGGRLFEANLSQLRVVWQFNLRTFVRGIFQYTSIERDPSLFIDEVLAKEERLFSQLLFSYKLNPQTVLFLGYGDTRLGEDDVPITQSDRSVFLKLGYAWVL